MELYLIRHAHAADSADDFSRTLSARGKQQIDGLVRHFRAHDLLRPEEVWHSPLFRARETAQRLGAGLGWRMPFVETEILEPECDPRTVALRLEAVSRPLALVAHEPLLSALGTFLVKGSPWPLAFTMRKGDILALESPEPGEVGRWVEKWHLGPELADLDD
jgi:phosphohistidine phosphatase SixA